MAKKEEEEKEKSQENDIFDDLIEEKQEKSTSDLEVLKELFSPKNVKTKTELNVKQINLINSKRMIAKMLKWDRLNECLNDFMLLSISKDRKGRAEFVDGFKAEREKELGKQNQGFMGNIKNKLGFG